MAGGSATTLERPNKRSVRPFHIPKPPNPLASLRRSAWRAHVALLPLLHAMDPIKPSNTCVNLQILWLKALAGAQGSTDDYVSYRMLPKKSRWIISRPFCWLFPPWHSETVARRTRFIDEALGGMLDEAGAAGADTGDSPLAAAAAASSSPRIHMITLGAGFDTRAMWQVGRECTTWIDVDLPQVIEQKRQMLQRLARRRPELAPRIPGMQGADLSTRSGRAVVRRAAASAPAGSQPVILCEALLMYLPDRCARALLRTCGRVDGARLVFADRLPGGVENREEAEALLRSLGLTLCEWRINSNMGVEASTHGQMGVARAAGDARALKASGARVSSARHMGVARAAS